MTSPITTAIVGYGAVGRGIHQLFPSAHPYDPPLGLGSKDGVNASRFAFICVPTPELPDGSCDTSIVEEAVSWIESEFIILRSTVPVGTTDRLRAETGKAIIFQPEYGPRRRRTTRSMTLGRFVGSFSGATVGRPFRSLISTSRRSMRTSSSSKPMRRPPS